MSGECVWSVPGLFLDFLGPRETFSSYNKKGSEKGSQKGVLTRGFPEGAMGVQPTKETLNQGF